MGSRMITPHHEGIGWAAVPTPIEHPLPYLASLAALLFIYYLQKPKIQFPLINPKRPFELTSTRSKKEFVTNSQDMILKTFKSNGEKPFRAIADVGEVLILPPQYADEIRNDARFSFSKHIKQNFHSDLPGFEPFAEGNRDSQIVKKVVQKQLTQALAQVTEPLSDECEVASQEIFTDNPEWHDMVLKRAVLAFVARMSSKIFLGDELCRNEEWLDITVDYAVSTFSAVERLRLWPQPVRPLVHWFLPYCQESRAKLAKARKIMTPVVEKRQAEKAAMLARGEDPPRYNDAIEWFENEAKGSYYDPVVAQIGISMAAIHTTSDLLTQVILDLAENQDMFEPLRQEIISTLAAGGWKKTSLYQMKLMDSVIKESQRLKPFGLTTMRRITTADVTLSDGTFIPRNTMTVVSEHRMWQEKVHKDAHKFDGYRFYNMRQQPGKDKVAQLVSTSPDHLGFGHGQHACPGRFFAANEVKIALCHLVMKYDWKLAQDQKSPTPLIFGFSMNADPYAKVSFRRRKEEMNISVKAMP